MMTRTSNNSTTLNSNWVIGKCDFDSASSRFDVFLFLTIAITTLVGNVIVFVCYSRFRSLRSTTNVFLISLSTSDLLVAFISIPYTFGVYLCQVRPPEDKRRAADLVYLLCDMLPSIASIYSLTLIAVDKAITVTYPFSHKKFMNQKTAGVAVAAMWAFVICISLLILVLDKNHFTLFIIFMSYITPVSFMIISYIVMGLVAKKHAKAINQWERTSIRLHGGKSGKNNNKVIQNGGASAMYVNGEVNLIHEDDDMMEQTACKKSKKWLDRHRAKFLWREFKAAATLLFLLAVFVIAWTPFMALNIKHYICPDCDIEMDLVKYFKIFHYSNSALNPILFVLLSKRWRCAFRIVLCYPKKNHSISEDTVTEMAEW